MNGRYRNPEERKRMSVIYAVLLAAFTVYAVLDTFVIAKVYTAEQPAASTLYSGAASGQYSGAGEESSLYGAQLYGTDTFPDENAQGQPGTDTDAASDANAANDAAVTSDSYSDGNIAVTLNTCEYLGTKVYTADIRLSSAQYLKTALAHNSYGRNIKAKTSETAAANGAILAINGDYYGARQTGYVLKNGVLYRDTAKKGQEDLVIYSDGSFEIIEESKVSAQELLGRGAVNILSFGPALVENGTVSVTTASEVGQAKASNPRTAIGVIDGLHYVFVVADGRTDESEGLTLYELAQYMQSLGVKTAYNLDGGGSSTMVFNGQVINNPTSGGRISERSVSDIVYIGY